MASFIDYLEQQQLSKSTIQAHVRKLHRYVPTLDKVADYNFLQSIDGDSQKLTFAGTISKFYKFYKKDNQWIIDFMRSTQTKLKPTPLTTDLTIKDIQNTMLEYYKKKQWKEFVVTFLLTTYTVRNMDLLCDVITSEEYMNVDGSKNYLVVRDKSILYVRNTYKTVKTYGAKTIIVRSHRFLKAVNQLLGQSTLSPDHLSRQVENITGITEAQYLKLYLKENNNTKTIKKVSKSRGTDVNTLLDDYADV
jgi:hypothetical protein